MAFGSGAQGYARAFSLSIRLESTFESIAAACRLKATASEAPTWGAFPSSTWASLSCLEMAMQLFLPSSFQALRGLWKGCLMALKTHLCFVLERTAQVSEGSGVYIKNSFLKKI